MHYDQLKRDLLSEMATEPYIQSSKFLRRILVNDTFTCGDLYFALEKIAKEDLKRVINTFTSSVTAVDVLVVGQISETQAVSLSYEFLKIVGVNAEAPRMVSKSVSYVPTTEWRAKFMTADVPNNTVDVWFPTAPIGDVKLRSKLNLVATIFGQEFFNKLRTDQQLGYVVALQVNQIHAMYGLRALVQSQFDTKILLERIQDFLNSMGSVLNIMPVDDFNRYVKSLVAQLDEKPKNLISEGQRYFNYLLSRSTEFNANIVDAEYVGTITKVELAKFVELFKDVTNTKRISEVHALVLSLESPVSKDGSRPAINEDLLKNLLKDEEQISELRKNSNEKSLPNN
jgi:secreted Zn-dependent insulinase-like peptidase